MMLEAENKKQVLRLTDVEVTRAKSLQEALTLLAQEGVTAIAGGTDVIVQGVCKPARCGWLIFPVCRS